ncbi:MAG: family 1 glycosylhydrolase, partial [Janthinobacterium lividum]
MIADRIALWGGTECTVSRVGDVYSDQTVRSGHHDRLSDLARFADLGITALRTPILWERTLPGATGERDFGWADAQLGELRRLGIRPIVGLIHHGSGPATVDLLSPDFAPGLAEHARAVAERFPWVDDWTPVNEPLTTARFACLYGHWYPHRTDEASLWLALLNEIDATRLSMREIRRVNPAARLVQTDDLGTAFATPPLAAQAEYENQRRWLTWDLLAGRVTPGHPLWQRIARHGLGDRLRAIADDPCPADVIGINHYICSGRFLTHEFARHPGIGPASDGVACINIEAVRTVDCEPTIGGLLREAAARYGTTIAITECHNGSSRDEQMRWFYQVWRAAEAARAEGIDIAAVTAWSLLGAYDWNSLLTRSDGHYEPGVFDARSDPPRATAMTRLLPALARGDAPPLAHIVTGTGWWQSDDRFFPDYRPRRDAAAALNGPPILITGGTGTLARALARACHWRGLAHVV